MGSTSTGTLSGSEYMSQRASTVGRLTYGFDNRYFAEFSFRVDGSTRFAPNKRWGFFPTVSASRVLSNEKFFTSAISPTIISQAKIRASGGIPQAMTVLPRISATSSIITSLTLKATISAAYGHGTAAFAKLIPE